MVELPSMKVHRFTLMIITLIGVEIFRIVLVMVVNYQNRPVEKLNLCL